MRMLRAILAFKSINMDIFWVVISTIIMSNRFEFSSIQSQTSEILGRYMLQKKGGFFGTRSYILTFSRDTAEIVDLNNIEGSREIYTINDDFYVSLKTAPEENLQIMFSKKNTAGYWCENPKEVVSQFLRLKDFYILQNKELQVKELKRAQFNLCFLNTDDAATYKVEIVALRSMLRFEFIEVLDAMENWIKFDELFDSRRSTFFDIKYTEINTIIKNVDGFEIVEKSSNVSITLKTPDSEMKNEFVDLIVNNKRTYLQEPIKIKAKPESNRLAGTELDLTTQNKMYSTYECLLLTPFSDAKKIQLSINDKALYEIIEGKINNRLLYENIDILCLKSGAIRSIELIFKGGFNRSYSFLTDDTFRFITELTSFYIAQPDKGRKREMFQITNSNGWKVYKVNGLFGNPKEETQYVEMIKKSMVANTDNPFDYINNVEELLATFTHLREQKFDYLHLLGAIGKFFKILEYMISNFDACSKHFKGTNTIIDSILGKGESQIPEPGERLSSFERQLDSTFYSMEIILSLILKILSSSSLQAQLYAIRDDPNSPNGRYIENFYDKLFDVLEFDHQLLGILSLKIVSKLAPMVVYRDTKTFSNVSKYIWDNLMILTLCNYNDTADIDDPNEEFRYFYYLSHLVDQMNFSSNNDYSEVAIRTLGSTLGRVFIANLHTYKNDGVFFRASELFYQYLIYAEKNEALESEQNFYLRYSIVLIKHYLGCIGQHTRKQKNLSARILHKLIKNNKVCAAMFFRMVPFNLVRKFKISRLKDIMLWDEATFLTTMRGIAEDMAAQTSNGLDLSVLVSDLLGKYIQEYRAHWHRIKKTDFRTLMKNVANKEETDPALIAQLIQHNHNFEEFKIDFAGLLGMKLIGEHYLESCFDEETGDMTIELSGEQAQRLFNSLIFNIVNYPKNEDRAKVLKVIVCLYTRFSLKKLEIIPFLLNILINEANAPIHYLTLQLLMASISCKDPYVKFVNLQVFLENDGLRILRDLIKKRLVIATSQNEVALTHKAKNYGSLVVLHEINTSLDLAHVEISVCLFIFSITSTYSGKKTNITSIDKFYPTRKTREFLLEHQTLNLILGLLISEDPHLVRAVFEFVNNIYISNVYLSEFIRLDGVVEILVYAKGGDVNCLYKANTISGILKGAKPLGEVYSHVKNSLCRLFPEYVVSYLENEPPTKSKEIFRSTHINNSNVLWSPDLYNRFRETIDAAYIVVKNKVLNFTLRKPEKKVDFPSVLGVSLAIEYPKIDGNLQVNGCFLKNALLSDSPNLVLSPLKNKLIELLPEYVNDKQKLFNHGRLNEVYQILASLKIGLEVDSTLEQPEISCLISFIDEFTKFWIANSVALTLRLKASAGLSFEIIICVVSLSTILFSKYEEESKQASTTIMMALLNKLNKRSKYLKTECYEFGELRLFSELLMLEDLICKSETNAKYFNGFISHIEEFDFHIVILFEILTSWICKEGLTKGVPLKITLDNIEQNKLPVFGESTLLKANISSLLFTISEKITSIVGVLIREKGLAADLVRGGSFYAIIRALLALNQKKMSTITKEETSFELKVCGFIFDTLAFANEATIRFFTAEKCQIEEALRGAKNVFYREKAQLISMEKINWLIETYRSLNNLLQNRFVISLLQGYQPDKREEICIRFLDFLRHNLSIGSPDFIWNSELVDELMNVLRCQIISIKATQRRDFTVQLDSFQSEVISRYTKYNGIYLEFYLQDDSYEVKDQDGLKNSLYIECEQLILKNVFDDEDIGFISLILQTFSKLFSRSHDSEISSSLVYLVLKLVAEINEYPTLHKIVDSLLKSISFSQTAAMVMVKDKHFISYIHCLLENKDKSLMAIEILALCFGHTTISPYLNKFGFQIAVLREILRTENPSALWIDKIDYLVIKMNFSGPFRMIGTFLQNLDRIANLLPSKLPGKEFTSCFFSITEGYKSKTVEACNQYTKTLRESIIHSADLNKLEIPEFVMDTKCDEFEYTGEANIDYLLMNKVHGNTEELKSILPEFEDISRFNGLDRNSQNKRLIVLARYISESGKVDNSTTEFIIERAKVENFEKLHADHKIMALQLIALLALKGGVNESELIESLIIYIILTHYKEVSHEANSNILLTSALIFTSLCLIYEFEIKKICSSNAIVTETLAAMFDIRKSQQSLSNIVDGLLSYLTQGKHLSEENRSKIKLHFNDDYYDFISNPHTPLLQLSVAAFNGAFPSPVSQSGVSCTLPHYPVLS